MHYNCWINSLQRAVAHMLFCLRLHQQKHKKSKPGYQNRSTLIKHWSKLTTTFYTRSHQCKRNSDSSWIKNHLHNLMIMGMLFWISLLTCNNLNNQLQRRHRWRILEYQNWMLVLIMIVRLSNLMKAKISLDHLLRKVRKSQYQSMNRHWKNLNNHPKNQCSRGQLKIWV